MIVLASLILGTLWAVGTPSKVESHVRAAICEITGGEDCGKPQAGGQDDGSGGQDGNGQDSGGQNGDTGGQDGNGGDQNGEPTLADLEKQAADAEKAASDADSKYGNIKQQIIDLLKDFIGITDIEECITKGSISSCLWAVFDVASWIFAALKIAKFAKAVKDAIKLWKVYNKGRKIIDRAKDAAKRAKEALRKRRKACGLPVPASLTIPRHAPPGRVVHAAFADGGTMRVTLAAAPAKPKKDCGSEDPGEGREPPPPSKGDLKNVDPDRLADEFGDDAAHEIKRETLGRGAKISRYDIKRDPKTGRLYLINKKDPKAPPIDTGYTSKGG